MSVKRIRITPLRRLAIYEREKGLCGICRTAVSISSFTIDHKVSLFLGGSNEDENLQVAHEACNLAKNAMERDEHGHSLTKQQRRMEEVRKRRGSPEESMKRLEEMKAVFEEKLKRKKKKDKAAMPHTPAVIHSAPPRFCTHRWDGHKVFITTYGQITYTLPVPASSPVEKAYVTCSRCGSAPAAMI